MKRKHEDEPEEVATETSPKRQKATHDTNGMVSAEQNQMSSIEYGEDMSGAYPGGAEKAFFGVLDEQEQEFFKNADSLLEQNDFPNAEERAAFLQSVFREADDKALKLAQSQSCSRVLERLIRLSTASQLKGLFQKFSGK